MQMMTSNQIIIINFGNIVILLYIYKQLNTHINIINLIINCKFTIFIRADSSLHYSNVLIQFSAGFPIRQ